MLQQTSYLFSAIFLYIIILPHYEVLVHLLRKYLYSLQESVICTVYTCFNGFFCMYSESEVFTMFWILSIFINSAPCLLAIIPLALLFSRLFPEGKRLKACIWAGLFSFLLAAMFSVTGVPSIYSLYSGPAYYGPVQWVPFSDMLTDPVQYILNFILFAPLGVLLPFLSPAFQRLRNVLLFGGGLSLFIEILQLFNFRATDVNDFLANTAGAALGFVLGKLLLAAFMKNGSGFALFADKWTVSGPLIICVGSFLIMFLIEPILSGFIWEQFYG